ncbi:MAG TPA: beta-ketoacyl-[acyl-carrier-protein] synthase family protein [Ktedonobacteraceae bacterium]
MTSTETTRSVVITGLGAIAPNGIGKQAFWQATRDGISGIQILEEHEAGAAAIQVGGKITRFTPADYLDRKLIQRTDRMTHLTLAAIHEALADAQLDLAQEQPQRVGAVIANTMGGVEYVLRQLHALYSRGPRALSAYTAVAWLHVANVGQTAIRHGIQGYCKTPVNDTVGGLEALQMAAQAIRRGIADVIIAGGSEACLHPFIMHVFASQGQCTSSNNPTAYRPFDQRATGLIMAEGAGICIMESYEHAVARGATRKSLIYGELAGYGQTNDAHGLVAPSADGRRYARAMQDAMQEAHLSADELAYISLDGHAIPTSDQGEVHALYLALGKEAATIPVSVPRTSIGHSYAAAGALDTIIALQALQHRCIPPTINCTTPDPRYEIHLIRDKAHVISNEQHRNAALVCGRATGGSNIVLAIKGAGEHA